MIKAFANAIREIRTTLTNLLLFDIAMNAVIIFLTVYLLLFVFEYEPFFAIIPAVLYFIVWAYQESKISEMREVEKAHDPLKEKLRTAVDNRNVENPIVIELQEEVLSELKHVRLSSFVKTKPLSYKILAVIVLCFVILLFAQLGLTFDGSKLIDDAFKGYALGGKGAGNETPEDYITAGSGGDEVDIYGEKSVAKLGNEEINLEIKPVSSEINVRDVTDIQEKEFDEEYPSEVFIEGGDLCGDSCKIAEGYNDIVKNYYKNLANS